VREPDNLTTFTCRMSWKSGSLNLLEPSGPHRACYGTAVPLPLSFVLSLLKCPLRVWTVGAIKNCTFYFRHGNKNDSPGPGPGQYNVTGLSAKGESEHILLMIRHRWGVKLASWTKALLYSSSKDTVYPLQEKNVFTTHRIYRSADKSLARPGRKQATATEDFDFHISYL
jgi:hypothetical protein